MKAELTFIEPLLGTCSGDPELARQFILAKHPSGEQQGDEEAALPDTLEKASTLFPKEKGKPFIWNYQVKGFLKDACGNLNRAAKMDGKEPVLKAHKKVIDGLVFVYPRRIFLQLPKGGKVALLTGEEIDAKGLPTLERPLRGQTPQGERIALARSEAAPIGTKIIVEIRLESAKLEKLITQLLDYGENRGLGQWRNASFGSFTWKLKR